MIEDIALDHWTWLVIAIVLAVLELIAPGVFFLWLAIASGITAAVAFVAPALGWPIHVAIFAVLAVVVTWAGKRFVKQHPTPSDNETLNKRAQQMLGQEFILIEPIVGGEGRVKIGDSPWRVHGPDLPKGARVKVVAMDGARIEVEAV